MTLSFDHAIILVHDLYQAMRHFQSGGFNPFFGGQHAGGKTQNALIVFADGSYLELLAPTSPELLDQIDPNDRSSFLFLMTQGEGLGGYAMFANDLEQEVATMQERGMHITLGVPNGRARPDGQMLQWRSAIQDSGSMTPFFIEDITPRSMRVSDDSSITAQPNGLVAITGLTISVPDISTGIQDYFQITGIAPKQLDNATARIALHSVNILITADPALAVPAQLLDVQMRTASGDMHSIKQFLQP